MINYIFIKIPLVVKFNYLLNLNHIFIYLIFFKVKNLRFNFTLPQLVIGFDQLVVDINEKNTPFRNINFI